MRLDKFLKNSRIIRRRTVAKEAAEQDRIRVNGRVAKAGTQLAEGDIIEIEFGSGLFKCRVLKLLDHVKKGDAEMMYESMVD